MEAASEDYLELQGSREPLVECSLGFMLRRSEENKMGFLAWIYLAVLKEALRLSVPAKRRSRQLEVQVQDGRVPDETGTTMARPRRHGQSQLNRRLLRPPYQIWKSGLLFLKNKRRTADPLGLKVDTHLHTVGDPDERNPAVHPVFLAIKSHGPHNRTRACSLAGSR